MNFKHVFLIALVSLGVIAFFGSRHVTPARPIIAPPPETDISRVSSADIDRLVNVSIPANSKSRDLIASVSEKLRQRIERSNARQREAVLTFKDAETYRKFLARTGNNGLQPVQEMPAFNSVRIRYDNIDSLSHELVENATDYSQVAPNFFMTPPTTTPQAQARAARTQVPVGNALLNSIGVIGSNAGWGNGITIAVLDSGVAADQTFGIGRLRALDIGLGTAPASGPEGGHGTAVASLAVGQSAGALGVAPSANLLSIRVAGDDGKSDSFSLAKGIVAATDAGAKIVNISLGGYGTNAALDAAIDYATSQGVVIVASAGNDQANQLTWPAADTRVISVGSVDAVGQQVIFSNSGQQLQITAPGLALQAAWTDGNRVSFSGTSGSAPIVAGAIAAVVSQDPSLTPIQAWQVLASHSNEAGVPGRDPDYGHGVLNVGWALARNDPTRADTAVASLYYDNANEQLQIVLQNRSAQGVASVNLKIEINGSVQQYPVNWLDAGATAIVNLPLSASQLAAAGQVDLKTELMNPNGLNDILPDNNFRGKTLNGMPGKASGR